MLRPEGTPRATRIPIVSLVLYLGISILYINIRLNFPGRMTLEDPEHFSVLSHINRVILIVLLLLLFDRRKPTRLPNVPKAHYANRKLIAIHHATENNIVVVRVDREDHNFRCCSLKSLSNHILIIRYVLCVLIVIKYLYFRTSKLITSYLSVLSYHNEYIPTR